MQITTRIKLDLVENGVPPIVNAKQFDENTRIIDAALTANGSAYILPDGLSVIFKMSRPDGTFVFYDADENNTPAVTYSGNVVSVKLISPALAVAGDCEAEVEIYDNSGKLSSFNFLLRVEKSPVSDDAISTNYVNVLTENVQNARAAQAAAEAAAEESAITMAGSVRYNISQTLTDEQKTQAQSNIGAAAAQAITAGTYGGYSTVPSPGYSIPVLTLNEQGVVTGVSESGLGVKTAKNLVGLLNQTLYNKIVSGKKVEISSASYEFTEDKNFSVALSNAYIRSMYLNGVAFYMPVIYGVYGYDHSTGAFIPVPITSVFAADLTTATVNFTLQAQFDDASGISYYAVVYEAA